MKGPAKTLAGYVPPSPQALVAVKDACGLTGERLAEMLGLSDGRQWRKYTGGAAPRQMSAAMLFTLAAMLELDEATVRRLRARMVALGAEFASGAEGGAGDVPKGRRAEGSRG